MADIAPMFERATGHKLAIAFVTLGEAVKPVGEGAAFDVVIMPAMPGVLAFRLQ